MKTVLVLLTVVSVVYCGCHLPPSQWCSSEETARACGVFNQCVAAMKPDPFAGPVNLTLYYESLCPDCKRFFATQLYQTWKAVGTKVLNLTLVPYGNARETEDKGTWVFECQHGKEECVGNIIETCSINILKDINVYFDFIYCMEGKTSMPEVAAKECAFGMGIESDLPAIMTCANGAQGNMLEHQMALMTDALNPPHQYVPWVTINGVHTEKMERMAEEDLLSLVCETYKGIPPKVCLQDYNKSGRCYRD